MLKIYFRISNIFVILECDCDYAPGGCHIVRAPPAGQKCYCKYNLFYTCSGWNIKCDRREDCRRPDTSKKYCTGDCMGY